MRISIFLHVFEFWTNWNFLWGSWMLLPDSVPIHLIDVEIFQWITKNFDLHVVLEEESEVYQSNWDSSSGDHEYIPTFMAIHDIQLAKHFTQSQKGQPHGGARGKASGSPKQYEDIIWMSAQHFIAIQRWWDNSVIDTTIEEDLQGKEQTRHHAAQIYGLGVFCSNALSLRSCAAGVWGVN